MKYIIIGNGSVLNTNIIKDNINSNDIIICCDGGTKYAFSEGILPHYILGDLDSSSREILDFFRAKNVIFKTFPEKKDETDMQLCLNFAISLGAKDILIFGAIGSRFDHSLANVNILKSAVDNNVNAKIINENNEIILIKDNIEILDKKGCLISLLPLSTTVSGVTTYGLEYPLNNEILEIGKSIGVSNVILEDKAKVCISDGYLIVIQSKD